jgi:hypothetical protein
VQAGRWRWRWRCLKSRRYKPRPGTAEDRMLRSCSSALVRLLTVQFEAHRTPTNTGDPSKREIIVLCARAQQQLTCTEYRLQVRYRSITSTVLSGWPSTSVQRQHNHFPPSTFQGRMTYPDTFVGLVDG